MGNYKRFRGGSQLTDNTAPVTREKKHTHSLLFLALALINSSGVFAP